MSSSDRSADADGLWWQNKRRRIIRWAEPHNAIIVKAQMTWWIIVEYCPTIVDRTVSQDELLQLSSNDTGSWRAESPVGRVFDNWTVKSLRRDVRGSQERAVGTCEHTRADVLVPPHSDLLLLAPFLILMGQSPSVCQELTPDALPLGTQSFTSYSGHRQQQQNWSQMFSIENIFGLNIHEFMFQVLKDNCYISRIQNWTIRDICDRISAQSQICSCQLVAPDGRRTPFYWTIKLLFFIFKKYSCLKVVF